MNSPAHHAFQSLALALLSAGLFVELYAFNGWLFAAWEHAQGVNWIFLPAGFRVLLVLSMGLPGAVGILLGNLWLGRADLNPTTLLPTLSIALASGFGPWVVKCFMEKRGLLDRHLQQISSADLLQYVLLYAAFNALSHQTLHWVFHTHNAVPWVDVWPMFIGDAIGALTVLYAIKWLANGLRQLQQSARS